jgi:hypothetical protein
MQSVSPFSKNALPIASAPEKVESAPKAAEHKNYGWILHPAIDVTLVCGGLIWIFALILVSGIFPELSCPNSKPVYIFSSIIYLLFAMPHSMATFLRVYNVKVTRQTVGIKVALLGVAATLTAIAATANPFLGSLIGRLTFCFSYQHFYAQAYGIGLLYCYKRNFILTPWEKRIYFLFIQSGILLGAVRTIGVPELNLFGLKLMQIWPAFPGWVDQLCQGLVVLGALAFGAMVARKWFVQRQLMPVPAIMTTLSAFFLFAILPGVPAIGGSLLVIYMLGHALFHTPQYLMVTTAVHLKNVGLPESVPFSKIGTQIFSRTALNYFLFLYAMAFIVMFFSSLSMCLAAPHMKVDLTMLFFCYLIALNLHHYWTDAIIWRMKDKENRRLLLN